MTARPEGGLPYRPCVGVMLLNAEGRVFVGQRVDTDADAWQMPQGGVDAGETLEGAALRELKEEVGTDRVAVLGRTRDWLYYDLPEALAGKVWGGQYRGQCQHWFAMRLLGGDALIDIETAHPEFAAWDWVTVSRLPELAIDFKRPVYRAVVAEMGHFARPVEA